MPVHISSLFRNYEADAYPQYAASVLASNDLFRSLMGAAFPLFARQMFENLEKLNGPAAFPVAWGCVLLGCIGLALCPLPFIFYKYGARIRKYSKYGEYFFPRCYPWSEHVLTGHISLCLTATSEKPVEPETFNDA